MLEAVEPFALAVVVGAFLVGGLVKGLSGVGLPLVALPILSLGVSMPTAVALTMAPILVSNGWQAVSNGKLLDVIRRFWPLQLTMAVTLLFSASLLVSVDNSRLMIAAGLILSISVLLMMLARGRTLPARLERPVGVLAGFIGGAIGAVSSLFGIPIIIYMNSLGLGRAEFLTSISVIYFFGAVPYVAGLIIFGAVGPTLMAASLLAVVPAMVGLTIAARLMRHVDDVRFRKVLNWILVFLGLMMVFRGMTGV